MFQSIILKVTLLFIFSSISFIFFAFYFINAEMIKNNKIMEQKYEEIIAKANQIIQNGANINTLVQYLATLGFSKVNDVEVENRIKLSLQNNHTNIYPIIVSVHKLLDYYYIYVFNTLTKDTFIYRDYSDENNYTNYYIFASVAFVTLIFFYILVVKSLLPLISLRKEVKKFASGNMDIKTIIDSKDEIGELSQEFTKAAYTINEINKARVLFLRSIMHELKTPITKGRLVTEMLTDKKAKDRLTSVFIRLNAIIDDFAKLEEISTKKYKVSKTKFTLLELMYNINTMLLIEDERPRSVIVTNREVDMVADFDAMSLSVKNLVDNAIKYSSNQMVHILTEGDSLIIKNKGAPFKDDINKYFKPFYNDGNTNNQKGLGLGMYIVRNTIEFQGFTLDYKYEKGYHYFYIRGCVIPQDEEH